MTTIQWQTNPSVFAKVISVRDVPFKKHDTTTYHLANICKALDAFSFQTPSPDERTHAAAAKGKLKRVAGIGAFLPPSPVARHKK